MPFLLGHGARWSACACRARVCRAVEPFGEVFFGNEPAQEPGIILRSCAGGLKNVSQPEKRFGYFGICLTSSHHRIAPLPLLLEVARQQSRASAIPTARAAFGAVKPWRSFDTARPASRAASDLDLQPLRARATAGPLRKRSPPGASTSAPPDQAAASEGAVGRGLRPAPPRRLRNSLASAGEEQRVFASLACETRACARGFAWRSNIAAPGCSMGRDR